MVARELALFRCSTQARLKAGQLRPLVDHVRVAPRLIPEANALKKDDFKPDTRYTVTWRDYEGKVRPANLYVYRLYDTFMVARKTDHSGFLYKIGYDQILKIVKEIPVSAELRFRIPDAVLKESSWADRTVMERYSTSPALGK